VVKVSEEVEIVGLRETQKTVCTGWRCSASSWTRARPGQHRGAPPGIKREEVERGRSWPSRQHHPHTRFKAEAYVLTKEEGGRHTPSSTVPAQFYFRTTDVTGVVRLPRDEMVMPGDNATLTVELIQPIAMEKELRFAIREGGRTVGPAW